jgi:hypothetical protein
MIRHLVSKNPGRFLVSKQRGLNRAASAGASFALVDSALSFGCIATINHHAAIRHPKVLLKSNLQYSSNVSFSTAAADVDVPSPPTSNHRHVPLLNAKGSVLYTETDEAPALATYSLYPIVSKVSNTLIVWRCYY